MYSRRIEHIDLKQTPMTNDERPDKESDRCSNEKWLQIKKEKNKIHEWK